MILQFFHSAAAFCDPHTSGQSYFGWRGLVRFWFLSGSWHSLNEGVVFDRDRRDSLLIWLSRERGRFACGTRRLPPPRQRVFATIQRAQVVTNSTED